MTVQVSPNLVRKVVFSHLNPSPRELEVQRSNVSASLCACAKTASAKMGNESVLALVLFLACTFDGTGAVTRGIVQYFCSYCSVIALIIYSAEVRYVTPRVGSIAGGTRIELHGKGIFAESVSVVRIL